MVKVSLKWVLYFWIVFVDKKKKPKSKKQNRILLFDEIFTMRSSLLLRPKMASPFCFTHSPPNPTLPPLSWAMVSWKCWSELKSAMHNQTKTFNAAFDDEGIISRTWCLMWPICFYILFRSPVLAVEIPLKHSSLFLFFPPSRLHASFTLWEKVCLLWCGFPKCSGNILLFVELSGFLLHPAQCALCERTYCK